jgi:hypothetical protein
MSVHARTYIFMYIYIYVCIHYAPTYVCTGTYICTFVSFRVCTYVPALCTFVFVRIYVYIYIHAYMLAKISQNNQPFIPERLIFQFFSLCDTL